VFLLVHDRHDLFQTTDARPHKFLSKTAGCPPMVSAGVLSKWVESLPWGRFR